MKEPEIICLSSDDEEVLTPKHNNNGSSIATNIKDTLKPETKTICHEDNKNEVNNKETSSVKMLKDDKQSLQCEKPINTRINQENADSSLTTDNKNDTKDKKRKLSEDLNVSEASVIINKKVRTSLIPSDNQKKNNSTTESCTASCSSVQKRKDSNIAIVKPQLVMKEKRSISPVDQDVFPMFISLCLQKDRSQDMEIIVGKLKRNYEQLDPDYARSESFTCLLNEKREAIANGKGIYRHIADLNANMKKNRKGKVDLVRKSVIVNQAAVPSSSSNDGCDNTESHTGIEIENTEDSEEAMRVRRRVRKILKAMEECEKEIARLEEEEVEFDEENDSSYIKLEKYKERIVMLYNKYCKLTGGNADAGRPYLRPKHFSSTQIVVVDQAISSFINSKIMNKNQKKNGALTDSLIFPDYVDILECISKCNESHNLGLSKRKQEHIAKKAFTELGEHLQRVRQRDYWDTFSLLLENQAEDPALKNAELAEKLKRNREEGEQRIQNLLQEYVKKQENSQSESQDEERGSDNKETSDKCEGSVDEDVIIECENISSKEMDKNKPCSEDDENNEQGKSSSAVPPIKCNADKEDPADNENIIVITDNVVEKGKKAVSISEENNIVDEDNDSEDKNITECEILLNDSPKNSASLENTNCITNSPPEVTRNQPEFTANNTIDSKCNETEAEVVESVTEDLEKNGQRVPLLRVRSFAKPPTTWADNQQKAEVKVQQKLPTKIILLKQLKHVNLTDASNLQNHKCISILPVSHINIQNAYKITVLPHKAAKSVSKNPPSPSVEHVKTNVFAEKTVQPTALIRRLKAPPAPVTHTKGTTTTPAKKLSKKRDNVSVIFSR